MKQVLIVVDMQVDFVTGVLGSQAAQAVVGPVAHRAERHHAAGEPLLFTMDTHLDSDYQSARPPREMLQIPRHCIRESEGWQIVPRLRPLSGLATVVEKPTFLAPGLGEFIRTTWGEDLSLELCGVCTDICVVSNALALRAILPDVEIRVSADLCAGTTPEHHRAALDVMRSCLVEVI